MARAFDPMAIFAGEEGRRPVCPSCDSRMVRPIRSQNGETSKADSDKVRRRCFTCGWEWSQTAVDDLEAS
jgi:RNase P subunit RPR2